MTINSGIFKSGPEHPRWNGGITKSHEYVMIKKPDHPFCNSRGYVMEHRLVWEEYHKAVLLPYADVHHKNGVKTDNRPENLEAMIHGMHSIHHNTCRRVEISARICFICDSNTTKYDSGRKSFCWYDCGDNKWLCSSCYHKLAYRERIS